MPERDSAMLKKTQTGKWRKAVTATSGHIFCYLYKA